ncbi:MAG: sensor histidine kinase [Anaerolineae bacterium]
MRHLRDNLLIQFSVVGFVVLAVVAVGLAWALSDKVRADAVNALIDEAVGASSVRLLRAITPADLEVPMTGERYERFHEFVQQSIVSERTARVKIWARDGTVIYSNNPEGVGQKLPDHPNFLKAIRGENATQIKVPEDAETIHEAHLGTLMEVYTPIIFPGTTEPQGVFEIYQYYAPTARRINSLRGWVFGSVGVGFLGLYLALVSIVWRGWRTIVRQRTQLESFNVELERQVQERTAALQEAQERLIRTERLAAIGELSAGVAHELRNPLGAIKNAAYYIRRKLASTDFLKDNPKVGQFLEIMDEEIEASNNIITDLMNFARVNPPNLSPTRLETVVDSALARIEVKENVKVVTEFEPDLPEVPVDGEQVRRAFTNLIMNANEAMPGGGHLTITAKAVDGSVELQFHDTGQGISEANLPKVFDPLFTTKPRGIGMGLPIVKTIIEKHEGNLDVTSNPEQGTTFTVRLPLNNQQEPQTPEEGKQENSDDRHQT